MNKKVIGIVVFVLAVVGFGAAIQFLESWDSQSQDPCAGITLIPHALAHNPTTATIVFTEGGVVPACSEVVSGGTVTWINNTSQIIEVSSDPHPLHTDNPEISNGKFSLPVMPGQSASVVLVRKGTWGFHDHQRPNLHGKIIVK